MSQTVGDSIQRNKVFLHRLALTRSPAVRKQLLDNATSDELLAVLEACLNILQFAFPIKPSQRKRLLPHAPFLRKLSRARSERSVRNILQTGGGGVFSALLLPVLSAVVGSLISSNI